MTSFGEKLQVCFSEVLSLDVRLSSVLMSFFSLFIQSFSRDHTGFFFLSETEKKLSSEVSALKAGHFSLCAIIKDCNPLCASRKIQRSSAPLLQLFRVIHATSVSLGSNAVKLQV